LAGNLLNRTLGLLKKNCQSTLAVDSTMAAEGNAFKDNVARLVKSLGNSNISVISILNFKACLLQQFEVMQTVSSNLSCV